MRIATLALLALALWLGIDDWRQREITQPAGVLASAEPSQRDSKAAPIVVGDYTLTPRAEFSLKARVLASERYRFDALSSLIPRDLALGWGPMSDSSVLAQIDISQSGRFYFWKTRTATPPIALDVIAASSANMHLIPANRAVARVLDRARVGQLIELDGQLVDVRGNNGRQMSTSLTRSDTGAGACEIIYVEQATTR